MITRISIKNFKCLNFEEELGDVIVFAGPNNSGKTSALQAITLWELGMRKWAENRKKTKAKQRVGVTINRRDLLNIPVPSAIQIWKDLHVRESKPSEKSKRKTTNILIEILAEGLVNGQSWELGFEFDYANPESLYCRILEDPKTKQPMDFPEIVLQERVGFLPPMSGLATEEDKFEKGSILSRLGQGRTAEVLRNLCWIIWAERREKWDETAGLMDDLFSITLDPPVFNEGTGLITMTYREGGKVKLDISNCGRGFHQILLILSFLYSGQNTILLMDEPDAHLEVIRQQVIFRRLSDLIAKENAQLIIATHSEALLNEAVGRGKIMAFLGRPHLVKNKTQLAKSLSTIGFDQYMLADQRKWVLYMEGSSDLNTLKAFADKLDHPAKKVLEDPFVKYVSNLPQDARNHFHALREAQPALKGIAIFDRISSPLAPTEELSELMWSRYEIENYLLIPEALYRFAEKECPPIFIENMKKIVEDSIAPAALKDKSHHFWLDNKMREFLDEVFRAFYKEIGQYNAMAESNFHKLVRYMEDSEIDLEVKEKLDAIWGIAKKIH